MTTEKRTVIGLLRSADLVRRRFTAVVAREGITLQQFNVLRILRGAAPAPLPTLAIRARMVEPEPGITRLLDRIEQKGLVHRVRAPRDRRQVLCSITDTGLALLARLHDPVERADADALSPLTRVERQDLLRLLDAMLAAAPEGTTQGLLTAAARRP